jgi:hypothetical protein
MFAKTLVLATALLALGCAGAGGGSAPAATTVPGDPAVPALPAAPADQTVPIVLVEPRDATVAQGAWASFSVEAMGDPTPAIQWYRDGAAITGANASSYYFIPSDPSLDGASFHAAVQNSAGTATSRDAVLHVACADAPLFSIQPVGTSAFPGAPVTFLAATSAVSEVAWVVDGTACQEGHTAAILGGTPTTVSVTGSVSSGTSSTLAFPAPATPGTYAVQAVATGSGVPVASAPVVLTVLAPASTVPTLSIQAVLLDQGIQLPDGSVPLVANRPGLLRVVGAASAFNALTPSAKVSVRVPGQAAKVFVIPSPGQGVPTSPDLRAWPSITWDVMLPASLIQPGARVAVILDPGGQNVTVPDWMIPCTPVPDLDLRFVPIVLAGGTPTVGPSAVQSAVQEITRLYPLAEVTAAVGRPFTPSVSDLFTVANINRVLVDLESKRIADVALRTYYQGIWQQGIDCLYAGLGFIASPANTSSRSSVACLGQYSASAHELGHNLGLQHAPCGSASNPDPDFPYSGGLIGLGQPVDTTGPGLVYADPGNPCYHDIMGYCGAFWISDYNYTKVFKALTQTTSGAGSGASACLLVSGFQSGRGGPAPRWNLRPAFDVTTQPSAPAPAGARIDLMNGDSVVASQTVALSDAEATGLATFVAAIPLPRTPITSIRVSHQGQTVSLGAMEGHGMAPTMALTAPGVAHLSWNHATHPLAMVRDEAGGEVVAILGGDNQELPVAPGHTYRVELSHNLGSTSHAGIVPKQPD